MKVERVFTNETCNENCAFCNSRQPVERSSFASRPAVRQRIDAARAAGASEILLTGGEPSLRRDLADLVGHATANGVRVTLETNGTLIDDARAAALAAAGLAVARVQLVAWGEASDTITRTPGGFDAALRGIRALAAAGIEVEVSTPVVRANLESIAALPREIVGAGLPVTGLVVVVPQAAPAEGQCASLEQIAAAVAATAVTARQVGLAMRLDPATFVPPCIFPNTERVAHLFALNRGNAARPDYEHVAACESCLVSDRCPGLPRAFASASPPLHPIVEQRLRRRLTVVSSVQDQVARELVARDAPRRGEFANLPKVNVRINFHCNQACEFCFVSTHLPPAAESAVRGAIQAGAAEGAIVVLTGGEPTLNPRLVEYVKLARTGGARVVELQSNAIRLGDPVLASALEEAGLDRAMISLHGSTAAISDAVTCAPGTFVSTVRGIDELVKTRIAVRLNFVFCQANRSDFPDFVDLVASRWPGASIVFSFVGSHTDVIPRSASLIPRFSEIMPSLLAGLERARAAGVEVSGFDSMCGLPLCLVPEREREVFSETATGDGDGEFVKAEACSRCSQGWRCFGVRRGYVELYGDSELRPFDGDAPAHP